MMDELLDNLLKEEEKYDKWVAFDFDGVCAQYTEWKGEDVFGKPIEGVANLIRELKELGYKVMLYTTRSVDSALKGYLKENGFEFDAINSCAHNPPQSGRFKPIAELYIDDRAFRFDQNDSSNSIDKIKQLLGREKND